MDSSSTKLISGAYCITAEPQNDKNVEINSTYEKEST